MDKWSKLTVSEISGKKRNAIVGGPFGSDLVSKDYTSFGVPVIRGVNMGCGRWVAGDFVYVSKEKADSLSANCAEPGDLVFTQRGTIGQVALVPQNDYSKYLISQSQMKLSVDSDKADSLFLYYTFTGKQQQKYIQQNAIRTGVPHTNLGILRDTPIFLPPLPAQKKISAFVDAIDSKIELNNKINVELEAMAKLIYDYWFVQFDFPDANGKPYKSSGGKMVFNETLKREIPDGWNDKELHENMNIFDSVRIPMSRKERDSKRGPYPYFGATGVMDYVDGYIFDDDYILVAEDGSIMNKKGMPIVQFIWGKTWVNNHTHVMQGKNKMHNEFYYQLLNRIPVVLIKTGSIQMKINQANLMKYKVLVPDFDLIDKYSALSRKFREKLMKNVEETKNLTELKDWLLPMLMNGQVTVKASQVSDS